MDKPKITRAWKLEAEKRRCLRRRYDLSLAVVAGRMGVNPSTLHRYEHAVVRPGPKVVTEWDMALYKEAV
jgi:transcriptional regulator with XRE-family HTH domain